LDSDCDNNYNVFTGVGVKIGELKAEIKLDSKAYDELCSAFIEFNNATSDMPWLNDVKERMVNAITETRIESGNKINFE